MAWVATDNDGQCFVYDERPQKCPGGYANLSGRARSFDFTTAKILGIPIPEPGEMIEWPSPAQEESPKPEMEEKTCKTCKWVDGPCCNRPGYAQIGCIGYRFWEPCEQDKTEELETGKKFDEGKLRYDLIPVKALREVVKVLTFGAKRYGENNWKITKPESRYTAAAMRHGEAYRDNEIHDPDSGFHHLAHRICCDLFLLQIDLEKEAGK